MLKKILGVFAFLMPTLMMAQGRVERNLKYWQFSHDSIHWQSVTVPHDWAIKGPFDKKWDLQMVAIEQNGESEKTEKSGRSGALPWIGKGYYTTNVHLDNIEGRHVELCFDGARALASSLSKAMLAPPPMNALRLNTRLGFQPQKALLRLKMKSTPGATYFHL